MTIPLHAQVIWIGNRPMPPAAQKRIERFMQLNPRWYLTVWDNDAIEWFEPKLHEDIAACDTYSGRANILRYEILDRFGGLYFDVDVHWLKPIGDRFFADESKLVMSWELTDRPNNSVMACVPGHPQIKKCLELVRSRIKERGSPNPSWNVTGPSLVAQLDPEEMDKLGPDKIDISLQHARVRRTTPYAIHLRANTWVRKIKAD